MSEQKPAQFPTVRPGLSQLISLGAGALALLSTFLMPWFSVDAILTKMNYTIFASGVDLTGLDLGGTARVFVILAIFGFLAYAATCFVDSKTLLKLNFDLQKPMAILFCVLMGLSLLFGLTGRNHPELGGLVGLAYGWFICLVLTVIFALCAFTNLASKIVKR